MIDRTTKLRFRRVLRRRKHQVEDIGYLAEEQLEKQFFKRLSKLTKVRRFIAAWVLLITLLTGAVLFQARLLGSYYLANRPVAGGVYTEGIVGKFTNANPLYADSSVDASIERLVFSGLFKQNQQNQLAAELATKWEVDEAGTTYTVTLRPNLKWQDDKPLTAEDVVFTYKTIQNPDAKSALASSWQGIGVKATSPTTIVFTLPSVLSAFPYSMTNGIIPKHLLKDIPPAQLRSAVYNTTKPVGAGPFEWKAIEVIGSTPEDREQRISLVPNDNYYAGRPKVDRLSLRAFPKETPLLKAFRSREIDGMAGLASLPADLAKDGSIKEHNIPLTSEVMIFLKTSDPLLSDVKVRQALAYATDTGAVAIATNRPVLPVQGPLLIGQLGFDPALAQRTNNLDQARKLLDEAGWKLGADGKREKNGQKLVIAMTTQANDVYASVSKRIKDQWSAVGVQVQVISQEDDELQSTLVNHLYTSLLYGISLGPDPDVFAYWHSSQADVRAASRLNFSEYRSTAADKSLEAGRTRSDPGIRALKYKPFLDAWRNDVPAIALYQPRYLYVSRGNITNFNPRSINSGADRFNNVVNWMIREQKQSQ